MEKKTAFQKAIEKLPFTDAYYIEKYGMDKANYLIYQEMVEKTAKFAEDLLEMEQNPPKGWFPFFK